MDEEADHPKRCLEQPACTQVLWELKGSFHLPNTPLQPLEWMELNALAVKMAASAKVTGTHP